MNDDNVPSFQGWEPPLENWSKLPHDLIQLLPKMNCAELKVTMYILRHTWGFGNYSGYVSMTLDEIRFGRNGSDGRIDSGTGLSKQSILTGLAHGVTRGTLEVAVDTKDRARIKKSYRLRGQNSGQLESKNLTAGVQKLDIDLDKDTLKDKSSPEVNKKKARKSTDRSMFNASMEDTFKHCTGIPLPIRNTLTQKRAAGRLWNTPLWNLYDLHRPEEERQGKVKRVYDDHTLELTEQLMQSAIEQMKEERLTVSTPASIEKVAISLFAEHIDSITSATQDFWDQYK